MTDTDIHRAWWQAMLKLIEFQTSVCGCGLPKDDEAEDQLRYSETCSQCEPLTRPMRELEKAGAMP